MIVSAWHTPSLHPCRTHISNLRNTHIRFVDSSTTTACALHMPRLHATSSPHVEHDSHPGPTVLVIKIVSLVCFLWKLELPHWPGLGQAVCAATSPHYVSNAKLASMPVETTERLFTRAPITKCSSKSQRLPHAWCCRENASTSPPQTHANCTSVGSP